MTINPRFIFWLPRIICIIAILFISVFALDAFQPELTVWQQIQAFAMHLIPSFVLLLILIIAWKWELAGGIVLVGIGLILVYIFNFRGPNFFIATFILTLMIVLLGSFFLLSWYLRKKYR